MKYALLFPGQGSQAVGMLAALGAGEPLVDETFNEASAVLGWDVLRLVREGPEEELNRTQRTQPALLAAGIAVWRVWRAGGCAPPAVMAGHSLGEYTALVAAGSIAFGDALRLVELRGELMQNAVPAGEGAMAAIIGLEDAEVEKICAAFPGPGALEPANFNAPGQVVVAGSKVGLDWLLENAKELGVRKVVPLQMSVPSHCSLMRTAAAQLAESLLKVEVRSPALPVIHNIDGKPRTEPDAIRDALIGQLHHPVRWSQSIGAMAQSGVGAFFECGPGKVLTNLNKRILGAGTYIALEEPEGIQKARASFETEQA
ncbi:ACP S-malonyltransferase [Nevskia soli]|uniref:ACP S-malonyltransferase n=1 Tax=Nevskia soli TaxID=418856 RepID=UPI0004A732B4|nr:ACP S-malonyltransferase [Nevskia soli]